MEDLYLGIFGLGMLTTVVFGLLTLYHLIRQTGLAGRWGKFAVGAFALTIIVNSASEGGIGALMAAAAGTLLVVGGLWLIGRLLVGSFRLLKISRGTRGFVGTFAGAIILGTVLGKLFLPLDFLAIGVTPGQVGGLIGFGVWLCFWVLWSLITSPRSWEQPWEWAANEVAVSFRSGQEETLLQIQNCAYLPHVKEELLHRGYPVDIHLEGTNERGETTIRFKWLR